MNKEREREFHSFHNFHFSSQRERERESQREKMKYLEGESTGAVEQGGLKSEAAEAMTRQQAICQSSSSDDG